MADERLAGGGMELKVGLVLPMAERRMHGATPRWRDLLVMAQQAEAIGADSLWLPDHFIFEANGEQTGQWECLTILAALAAVTQRVELGTMVLATSFRNPALLAKMADTIEEISGGRLILGLGAGWNEHEYRAFGYPFDHRASRFEEALTIVRGLLRQGQIDFRGDYYQARDCRLQPRGPRVGGPPILIGTRGERMLRLTAQYADYWNVWLAFGQNRPEDLAPALALVDAACATVGRPPATLGRTAAVMVDPIGLAEPPVILARAGLVPRPITGRPTEIAERLAAFGAAGIGHLQVHLHPNTLAGIEAFGPVLAALRARG